jgi:hypothetical protein
LGDVYASFNTISYRSLVSPHFSQWCTNDVAIGKLHHSRPTLDCRPVGWDTSDIDRDSKLFLIRSHGERVPATGAADDQRGLKGALGGFRYVINQESYEKERDLVSNRMVIWRCEDMSVQDDSGAVILRLGDDNHLPGLQEWHATAFQSYELSEEDMMNERHPAQHSYWKLAVRPPEGMTKEYCTLIPKETLRCLERDRDRSEVHLVNGSDETQS